MFNSKKLKAIKNQGNIVFKSRFLRSLSPVERYEFLQLCHRRKFKAGEVIYYQGDPGTGLYFIEEGQVELVVEPEDDQQKKPTFQIEAPEAFGGLSVAYELRRISTARCTSDCTLLGFFKPDFATLRDRHPRIAIKILETLSRITMKQLERTSSELMKATDIAHAFAIQFEVYYQNSNDTEETL